MMIRFLFLLLFYLVPLSAAGPMTHLYLAERYCDIHNIQDENWTQDFIIGSLFPDIRYISHLPRENTHPQGVCFDQIQVIESGFEAGVKFHAWADLVREAFVVETGIYDSVIPFAEGHQATLLKFIEEEVLAEIYDGRRWSFLFNQRLSEEQAFGISNEVIQSWHTIIQYTMHYRPSWLIWGCSYFKKVAFGISDFTLYNWSYLLPQFAKDPLFHNHTHKMLEYVENKLYPPSAVEGNQKAGKNL